MSTVSINYHALHGSRFLQCFRDEKPYCGSDVWTIFGNEDQFQFVRDMRYDSPVTLDQAEEMGLRFAPHPAAELPDLAPFCLERFCVDRGVYPTESGLANLSRCIGYAESMIDCGSQALGVWLLHGLWQNIELLGHQGRYPFWAYPDCPYCGGSCVRDHAGKPFMPGNGLEACEGYQSADDQAISEIKLNFRCYASKTVLYGEDQFNFAFLKYYPVNPDEWRDLTIKYRENHPEVDHETLLMELETKNKIARETDGSLAYGRLHDWSFGYDKIRYKQGYNGGMIRRWDSSLAFKTMASDKGFEWNRDSPAWGLHS